MSLKVTIDYNSDLERYFEKRLAILRERWRMEHPSRLWRKVAQKDAPVAGNVEKPVGSEKSGKKVY